MRQQTDTPAAGGVAAGAPPPGVLRFSLATWNINSVRFRLDLVETFVRRHRPDILCLQETKCVDGAFPLKRIRALGFDHVECHGQKGHHGVAILSRLPIARLASHDFNGTGQARHLAVAIDPRPGRRPVVLHNVYVPAGGDVPDPELNPRFRQKLAYLAGMTEWFEAYGDRTSPRMILVGDLNVAPLETDVWSHRQLLKVVSHTPVEVAHLERLRETHDWIDVMRVHVPPQDRLFTWWSYRARDWRASNRGRRLDHVWTTPALRGAAVAMQVIDEARDWQPPSDHVPVVSQFAIDAGAEAGGDGDGRVASQD